MLIRFILSFIIYSITLIMFIMIIMIILFVVLTYSFLVSFEIVCVYPQGSSCVTDLFNIFIVTLAIFIYKEYLLFSE